MATMILLLCTFSFLPAREAAPLVSTTFRALALRTGAERIAAQSSDGELRDLAQQERGCKGRPERRSTGAAFQERLGSSQASECVEQVPPGYGHKKRLLRPKGGRGRGDEKPYLLPSHQGLSASRPEAEVSASNGEKALPRQLQPWKGLEQGADALRKRRTRWLRESPHVSPVLQM